MAVPGQPCPAVKHWRRSPLPHPMRHCSHLSQSYKVDLSLYVVTVSPLRRAVQLCLPCRSCAAAEQHRAERRLPRCSHPSSRLQLAAKGTGLKGVPQFAYASPDIALDLRSHL